MNLKTIVRTFLLGYTIFIPIFALIWWWTPVSFSHFEIKIVWITTEFLTFLMLSQLHWWTNVGLMRSMYHRRKYEFRRHAPKHIILMIITQACIYYLVGRSLLEFYVFYCINFDKKYLGEDATFDNKGICY